MKNLFITVILITLLVSNKVLGQRYMARNGYVRFYSEAPVEDIEAINHDGLSIFDLETKDIAFTVPIRSFQFEKKLMQEHFNENYLESDKYPQATFKGTIENFKKIDDEQKLTASGDMTIHGVTKHISVDGTGTFTDGHITLKAVFPVRLEDYKVKIPKVVIYNIAEVVEVTIEFEYTPYENN